MALCNLFLLIIHAAPSAEDTTVSTELVPAPFRLADSHTRLAWAKTLMYQLPQEILENVLRHTPPPASVKRGMDAVITELEKVVADCFKKFMLQEVHRTASIPAFYFLARCRTLGS